VQTYRGSGSIWGTAVTDDAQRRELAFMLDERETFEQ
jgi:hypothetical protein